MSNSSNAIVLGRVFIKVHILLLQLVVGMVGSGAGATLDAGSAALLTGINDDVVCQIRSHIDVHIPEGMSCIGNMTLFSRY